MGERSIFQFIITVSLLYRVLIKHLKKSDRIIK
jgi:hypothetical protein